jgi:hypothetical protein
MNDVTPEKSLSSVTYAAGGLLNAEMLEPTR